LHLLLLTAVELGRRRDTVALVLAVWILIGLIFATVLNWTVSARSLLPIVPAAAILLVRRLDWLKSTRVGFGCWLWPLLPSAAFSLCVAAADFQLANSARVAAALIATWYLPAAQPVWFQGHWGFQYYMQKVGAQPVDFAQTTLQPGNVLVVPSDNSNIDWPDPGAAELLKVFERRVCSWLSTMQLGTGAGFYAADWGPLPFVAGPTSPERYTVLKILRPLQFRLSRAMYRLPEQTLQPQVPPPATPADYEAALRANPDDANAHAQLALLLVQEGKIAEAIGHYREALRITPDDPAVLNNFACTLMLAGSPELRDPPEALRLATKAVELTNHREPALLGTLAAAYAETGQFSRAIEAAQAARDLALAADQKEMAAMQEKLLELYRAGKTAWQMTNRP
jgi:hypothetical protein